VKRKADTTTPCTATTNAVLGPAAVMPSMYKQPQSTSYDHSINSPASLACQRESRTVKKPKKDLDDDLMPQPVISKSKKEPMSEQMKYLGVVLKELFSKKHFVSIA
jgi:hypothetical protein